MASATIRSIEAIPLSIPRDTPYLGPLEAGVTVNDKGYFIRPGNSSIYPVQDQTVLVKITDSEGRIGWGECTGFIGPQVSVAILNEIISPLVIGKQAHDAVRIYQDLYDGMRVRGYFGGFYHDALAALDIALWDLRGKEAGLAVCQLLGADRGRRIPAYVSGLPKATLEARAELAREWVSRGFGAIKFAAAVAHDGEVEEMRGLRQALGAGPRILIDMHWKYTALEAIHLIKELEAYDLYLAEAPVNPEDIDGLAQVAASVSTSIGIGEELRTVYEYRPRFTGRCMNVIQPEMGRTGITAFWKIAQLAEAFHCRIMPHASIGIGIFQAASLHVSAALPNVPYHEYQHSIFDKNLKYLSGNMACSNGWFTVPDGPGLGVEPTEEALSYRIL